MTRTLVSVAEPERPDLYQRIAHVLYLLWEQRMREWLA